MSDIKMKKCIDCKKEYPATTEYFYRNGNRLQVRCKKCQNLMRKNNRKKEKEKFHKSSVIITEKEEKAFTKKAEEFGMSKTDFLKLMVLKGEAEPLIRVNSECFMDLNRQITGIATNINQIAYVCNSNKIVRNIDVENLREEVKKMRAWISKLEEEVELIDTSIKYSKKIMTFDDI